MSWNKTRYRNGLLYVILDNEVIEKHNLDIFYLARVLSLYGVDIFQFRFKNMPDNNAFKIAKKLSRIIHRKKKIFIVNDRVDIAYLSGADGVHLGKYDISPKYARLILGKNRIIGKTVHSSVEFTQATEEGIDYLSLGPVFKTETKPNLSPWDLREIARLFKKTKKMTFVIGGINIHNILTLTDKGLTNIALCRGLILSNNLKETTAQFKRCLQEAS